MKDFLLTTAEEAGIKFQYHCAKGGTDEVQHTWRTAESHQPLLVSARYIHSHQTLYAMDDFLQAQAFLQALVKKLDRSTVDLINTIKQHRSRSPVRGFLGENKVLLKPFQWVTIKSFGIHTPLRKVS